jgi:hypothetical protein
LYAILKSYSIFFQHFKINKFGLKANLVTEERISLKVGSTSSKSTYFGSGSGGSSNTI